MQGLHAPLNPPRARAAYVVLACLGIALGFLTACAVLLEQTPDFEVASIRSAPPPKAISAPPPAFPDGSAPALSAE
jgi:hypothetical protein